MRKMTGFLLAVSLIMIGIGIYRDETATVLNKAINICLECVGIG
ncbi:MAG: CD1871A family CXXC motif-containing protein [Eubacteriales bacterium]|nr:CD1871A family CXXC motif-containing protein [Eubacteriales bacterium]